MRNSNARELESRVEKDLRSSLDDLLREGARRMLQSAIEVEVAEHIDRHKGIRDDAGHRLVVRNGSLPERDIVSGVGPLRIRQPRVHDRRDGYRFTSNILPPFMRRMPSIDSRTFSVVTVPGIRRRANAFPGMRMSSSRFMISRPSTGFTYVLPTRSNQPSPRYGIVHGRQRAADRGWPP